MESESYYLSKQLKQYKAAISDAFKQFQLDDESRIAAARAAINSEIADLRALQHAGDGLRYDLQKARVEGMLRIAAVCHLVSFDDVKEFKKQAGIETISIPIKIEF